MPTAYRFTPDELTLAAALPESDLVDLAIELDLAVGAQIDRHGLLLLALDRLAELARQQGLPLSAWDLEELQALPPPQLDALASCLGQAPRPELLVQAGQRVFKRRYGDRTRASAVPLLLPSLLPLLARYLQETEGRPPGS